MKQNPQTPLEIAEKYLARGWQPIPIPFMQKNPNRKGWQKLILIKEELANYFNGVPQNVGVLLGEPSTHLIDVDLDAPLAVKLAPQFLPINTLSFGRASSPRSHFLYEAPNAKTKKYEDPNGTMLLEIRGKGAQTVFPASVHPSGEVVEFEDETVGVAKIPAEELEKCADKLAAACLLIRHWPKEKGARHKLSLALHGGLLRAGWAKEKAMGFIKVVATEAGDDEVGDRVDGANSTEEKLRAGEKTMGWPTAAEILGQDVVRKACEWLNVSGGENFANSADNAQAWEKPIPFEEFRLPDCPTDVFPSPFREFIRAEAMSTQTPEDLSAMLVLSAAALCLAKKVVVHAGGDWIEPTNIFTCGILNSGERKSPVFDHVKEPLKTFEAELAEGMKNTIVEAKARRRLIEKSLREAEKQAAKSEKLEDEKRWAEKAIRLSKDLASMKTPSPPLLFTEDVTPEGFAMLLKEHDGRMGVFSDEGGIFEIMAGRYSNDQKPNIDLFLKGYSGGDYRRNRVVDGFIIENPAITFGLVVQWEVISKLSSNESFRGKGLLARYCYSYVVLKSKVGQRKSDPFPVSKQIRENYHSRIIELLGLELHKDKLGKPDPYKLTLTEEARRDLMKFQDQIEPRLGESGDFLHIKDWGLKLAGQVVRIAGILHSMENAQNGNWEQVISATTMKNAIRVGEYLIPHAKATFSLMGADPSVEGAKHVLKWIKDSSVNAFSRRDAFNGTRARFGTVKKLELVLSLLLDHHFIREVLSKNRQGSGRKPSQKYEVNPETLGQNAQNTQN